MQSVGLLTTKPRRKNTHKHHDVIRAPQVITGNLGRADVQYRVNSNRLTYKPSLYRYYASLTTEMGLIRDTRRRLVQRKLVMNKSGQRHDLHNTKNKQTNRKRSKSTVTPTSVRSTELRREKCSTCSSQNYLPHLVVVCLRVGNRLQADGHDDKRGRRHVLHHGDEVAFQSDGLHFTPAHGLRAQL